MDDNLKGFPKPYTDEPAGQPQSMDDGFDMPTTSVNQQPYSEFTPDFIASESDGNNVKSDYDDWSSSGDSYVEPDFKHANKTAGKVAVGAVTFGFIVKAIICFLFPALGMVCAIISAAKGHKSRSKIYGLMTGLSIILAIVASLIAAGISIKNTVQSEDFEQSSYTYEDVSDDYSYDTGDDSVMIDTPVSEPSDDSNTTENNTNWNEYIVYINGVKVKLPMKYSDFKSQTGFYFEDPEDATSTLKSNQYTLSCTAVNDSGEDINIRMINLDDSQVTYENAYVGGINTNEYESNNAVFAGNMHVGDTFDKDSMISLFGEPTSVYDSDDNDFHIYTYEDEIYNSFEIEVSDGLITDIDVQHFE